MPGPGSCHGNQVEPLAFAEYGRIAKTLHLLAVVDLMDDTYRRQMHKQPTVQEFRHKLARECSRICGRRDSVTPTPAAVVGRRDYRE